MMKLAADQNFDVSLLSQTSQKMLRLREPVLEEWKKRVRSSCQATMALREPTFPSTIPPFFDNLIQTLSPGYPGVNTAEGASVAYVHGAERAKMTNYDIENLILEYQIFRAALFHVLADNYVG